MTPAQHHPTLSGSKGAGFQATRWTMVLAAADAQAGTRCRRALEELANIYWYPLYAYIRRQGHDAPEAEDLTQEFFARLLEKKYLTTAHPSKGKFRSFLLVSAKHFLCNEWDKARAQKRGAARLIAWDAMDAAARYAIEPVEELTPERLFERRWALAVLDQVLVRLRHEYRDKGQTQLFDALKGALTAPTDAQTAADLARRLGMTAGAVTVATHRLRRNYRRLLRDEIAQTVDDPALVEEEIDYLLGCL